MKNNKFIRSFSMRNISDIRLIIFAAAFCLGLSSCSKEEVNEDPQVESNFLNKIQKASATTTKGSSGTSIETITFTATAMIDHCHGENIRFTGEIENRVSTTTDANGIIHYARSFNTRGMTGLGAETGTVYDVLGGAEMFAIKDVVFTNGSLNLSQSISESDIVIHQGTLVFQSRTDNSKVVARHIIRKVPGQDTTISKWICAGRQ